MSNSKSIFAGNKNSQYDPGSIEKEVHDFYGQSLRTIDTRSLVDQYYTHLRADYDINDKPIEINYYRGTKSYRTSFNAVLADGLGGTYFTVHSAPDNQKYAIWFNLDGTSLQPIVANANYIEIPVSTGDSPEIVAFSLKLVLDLYKDYFLATRNGANIEIKTTGLGEVDNSNVGTTPFTFSLSAGTQELVTKVELTYSGTDPIFEGQVLKGYNYDIYSGKFVRNLTVDVDLDASTDSVSISDGTDTLAINNDGSINVNIVSTGQVLKSYFNEELNVANGITTIISTYTAVADVYLQKAEVSGTNIAKYELYVDNVLFDRKLTYFGGPLESVFEFNQGLNITSGSTIEITVVHNRPDPGDFTCRLQILE